MLEHEDLGLLGFHRENTSWNVPSLLLSLGFLGIYALIEATNVEAEFPFMKQLVRKLLLVILGKFSS